MSGAAHILRTANLPIEFCGFVEGDDISASDAVDVIVTDGFTGNIALKTAEGTAKLIAHFCAARSTRSFFGTAGRVHRQRRFRAPEGASWIRDAQMAGFFSA